jgi:outer membrane lipopolysaccharide assembly protein LptE/RlpB
MTIVLLSLLLAQLGCGYSLVGRGNFLPPDHKNIQVLPFVNRTTRVELEQRVTQAVAEELVSRGGLRLVSSPADADLVLRGSIDSFNINPVALNERGLATQYQVTVTAKIELLDHRAEDKVLWKNDAYVFNESYPVNVEAANAFDQETRAIREIAERFSRSLVTNLLEGF